MYLVILGEKPLEGFQSKLKLYILLIKLSKSQLYFKYEIVFDIYQLQLQLPLQFRNLLSIWLNYISLGNTILFLSILNF